MRGVLIVSLIFFGLCNYSEYSFGMFRRFLGFMILCGFYRLWELYLWFVQFQELSLNLLISRIIWGLLYFDIVWNEKMKDKVKPVINWCFLLINAVYILHSVYNMLPRPSLYTGVVNKQGTRRGDIKGMVDVKLCWLNKQDN